MRLQAIMDGNMLPLPGAKRLAAGGVPWGTIGALNGAGLIGAGRVTVSADGLWFEPEGPDARLLLGICNGAGELVDVAALSASNEDEWALLTGAADLLGEAALEQAVATDARYLRLHPTPMAWLRARGHLAGICVLQWSKAALGALRSLPEATTLVVDPGTKERLRGLLAFGGLPQIAEDRAIRRAQAAAGGSAWELGRVA